VTRITKTCDYNIRNARASTGSPHLALFGPPLLNFSTAARLSSRLSARSKCRVTTFFTSVAAHRSSSPRLRGELLPRLFPILVIFGRRRPAEISCQPRPLGFSAKTFGCARVPPRCPCRRIYPRSLSLGFSHGLAWRSALALHHPPYSVIPSECEPSIARRARAESLL
jgi:hypothetical protein